MTGEDGECAVDLFGKDDVREFVGQRDASEGEGESGAGVRSLRPSVGWSDGKDNQLCAGVAQTAEPRGKVLAGELVAAAVAEDEGRGGSGRLPIQPCEQSGLGVKGLCFGWGVAAGADEVFRSEGRCRGGLGAGFGGGDGGEDKLHGIKGIKSVIRVLSGNYGVSDIGSGMESVF